MKFPLSRKQFFASNLVNWKDKKRNHDKRNRARAMVFRKNCKRYQTNMTKTSQFLLPQRAAASLWFSIFLMNGVPTRGGLLLCTIPARVTEAEFIVLIPYHDLHQPLLVERIMNEWCSRCLHVQQRIGHRFGYLLSCKLFLCLARCLRSVIKIEKWWRFDALLCFHTRDSNQVSSLSSTLID